MHRNSGRRKANRWEELAKQREDLQLLEIQIKFCKATFAPVNEKDLN